MNSLISVINPFSKIVKTQVLKIDRKRPQPSHIREAVNVIKSGGLVAFPTETVYGLGANALDAKAVKRIFVAKGRPSDNPLIVHIADKDDVKMLAGQVPDTAWKLIDRFWPGPLTIVLKKSKIVPKITTGGLDSVAIRMPKSKIACRIIRESKTPIAAPSANYFGRPSPTKAEHVLEDMRGRIDMIIDGGQTRIGIESTVIDLTAKTPTLLRPGGVTLEQLKKTLGKVRVHPQIRGQKSKGRVRSPGMKYKHYSPRAQVILITGKSDNVHKRINAMIAELKNAGKRVGIIVADKAPYDVDAAKFVGARHENLAATLFKTFREFDSMKIDVILVQGVPKKGLGLGIMNRLEKAARK
jgi:L-threonylcarbamoyladenylate synthase